MHALVGARLYDPVLVKCRQGRDADETVFGTLIPYAYV